MWRLPVRSLGCVKMEPWGLKLLTFCAHGKFHRRKLVLDELAGDFCRSKGYVLGLSKGFGIAGERTKRT